jgi:DNA-binding PadR family transcriptional regulator
MRYTEVGTQLAVWSGLRPSDSAITRALNHLKRTGLVTKSGGGNDHRRGIYAITDQGRRRLARIAALMAAAEGRE